VIPCHSASAIRQDRRRRLQAERRNTADPRQCAVRGVNTRESGYHHAARWRLCRLL